MIKCHIVSFFVSNGIYSYFVDSYLLIKRWWNSWYSGTKHYYWNLQFL